MKPILYWTLARSTWYGFRFAPLGVTSTGPRGRVNGRFEDDAATHTTERCCSGKFDTLEAAKAKLEIIKKIRFDHEAYRKPLYTLIHKDEALEERQIKEACVL